MCAPYLSLLAKSNPDQSGPILTGAYLVMCWLPGSLRQSLKEAPWSLVTTIRVLDQVMAALHFAHRNQIIHRDLKPDNILLDEDKNAYLAEFGIARILDQTI